MNKNFMFFFAATLLCGTTSAMAAQPFSLAYVNQASDLSNFKPSAVYTQAAHEVTSQLMAPVAAISGAAALMDAIEPSTGSFAWLVQSGDDNLGDIKQVGVGNVGIIQQLGHFNVASISQVGGHQHAMILQSGNSNNAFISQR